MTEQEKEKLREFIAEQVNGARIDDDEDLFDSGYVNSLFAVQLVMWIERVLGVPVGRADLDIANFRSISIIATFVENKRVQNKRAGSAGRAAATAGGPAWTSD